MVHLLGTKLLVRYAGTVSLITGLGQPVPVGGDLPRPRGVGRPQRQEAPVAVEDTASSLPRSGKRMGVESCGSGRAQCVNSSSLIRVDCRCQVDLRQVW